MPGGLIMFVNNDLVPEVQSYLMQQIFIDEAISLAEFEARITGTPTYPLIIRQNGIGLLVVDSYYNLTNPFQFDLCTFLKTGLLSVLKCRGTSTPGITFPVDRLSRAQLFERFPCLWEPWCFDDGYCLTSDGYLPCCEGQPFPSQSYPGGSPPYPWQRCHQHYPFSCGCAPCVLPNCCEPCCAPFCSPVPCCNNQTIQNNILFPLEGRCCGPSLFPFGERCNSSGLVEIPNPYNLLLYNRCKE